MINLLVSYQMSPKWKEVQRKIDKAVGFNANSSGAGFGVRELEYEFGSLEEAQKAVEQIQSLQIEDIDWYLPKN